MFQLSVYILFWCLINGAQTFYGEVPENIPTFLIKIQREQSEFYGGIIVQGQWVDNASLPELKSKSVEIVVDTPWETPQIHRRELGHRIELSYEAPVLRKKKLEDGWKKAGYVLLDNPQGKKVIKETTYKQALQAIEMAQSIYQQNQPPELLYSPSGVAFDSNTNKNTFMKQWIFHILIVVSGILCLSFIIWKFLLTSHSS
ncbi:MAG: hypothetical protein ACP5QY_05630 [Candidatus Hydrogenedens sp.]